MHIYKVYYENAAGEFSEGIIRAKSFVDAWIKARDRYGKKVYQIKQECSCGGMKHEKDN